MTLPNRDRAVLLSGLLVVLGTVATLIATPPPPQLSASTAKWTAYLHANQTGVLVAALATSIVALAFVGFASRLPGRTRAIVLSLAAVWAAATLAGASAQAFLAQQSQRLGGQTFALVGLSRAFLYVIPAFAGSALLAAVAADAVIGWWRNTTFSIALITGAAGVWTLLSTSGAAAGAGFAARLLFTVWVGVEAWRQECFRPRAQPAASTGDGSADQRRLDDLVHDGQVGR